MSQILISIFIGIIITIFFSKSSGDKTKVDKGFSFNYFQLTYRRKLIRTLKSIPILIFVLLIIYFLLDWETSMKSFLTFFFIAILVFQLIYNYIMWKKEERHCEQCGHENDKGDNFCEECGSPLKSDNIPLFDFNSDRDIKGRRKTWAFAIIAFGVLLLITYKVFGDDVPDGISKEHYKEFVDSYELYEERVEKYNGAVIFDVGMEDFDGDEELLVGDIRENAAEDRGKRENGEKGIFTEKEKQLYDDFNTLYSVKGAFQTLDKELNLETPKEKYGDPIQASIDLEKRIIDNLELDKKSITAELQEEQADDSQDADKKEKNRESEQPDDKERRQENEDPHSKPDINDGIDDNHSFEKPYESEDDSETDWDETEFLNESLEQMNEALNEVQNINDELMSFELDEDNAKDKLQDLERIMGELEEMTQDPEDNDHLDKEEIEDINHILKGSEEIIDKEEQLIEESQNNDVVSTDTIRKIQSDISDMISDVNSMKSLE